MGIKLMRGEGEGEGEEGEGMCYSEDKVARPVHYLFPIRGIVIPGNRMLPPPNGHRDARQMGLSSHFLPRGPFPDLGRVWKKKNCGRINAKNKSHPVYSLNSSVYALYRRKILECNGCISDVT